MTLALGPPIPGKALRRKLVVIVDTEGSVASNFMANQALYHPQIAKRTAMLCFNAVSAQRGVLFCLCTRCVYKG